MKGLQPITNHHPGCLPTRYTFRTFVSQADPRVQPMKSLLQNHGHWATAFIPGCLPVLDGHDCCESPTVWARVGTAKTSRRKF